MTAANGDRVDEVLIKYGDDCIEGKAVYTYRLKEARTALDTAYGTRMLELIGEPTIEDGNGRYNLKMELRQIIKETYGL